MGETLKVIVPVITFLLGLLVSMIKDKSQFKISKRSFLAIEELYAPLGLKKLKVEPNTKLFVNDDYEMLNKEAQKMQKNLRATYLKIWNIGPGSMINCSLKFEIEHLKDSNMKWKFDYFIPLIQEGEYIIVPAVNKDMIEAEIFIKKIVFEYTTQAYETMYYEEERYSDSENCRQTLSVDKTLSREPIYSHDGPKSVSWIYLNSKNED